MITLTITSESAAELVDQIRDLQSTLVQTGANPVGAKELTPSKETLDKVNATLKEAHYDGPPIKEAAPVEKEKKPRAAKPAAQPAAQKETEVVTTPVQTETVPTSTASTGLTKEDIAEATQKVSAAKNLEVARGILAQFSKEDGTSCARISDVQMKDYENYIATCNATIEG